MSDRRCQAMTRAGKPCQSPPRADTGLCNAHSPREAQESVGFGGSQPGAGRPRLPRPHELMRERVEQRVDEVLAPYFDALTGAVVHGFYQGDFVLTEHPDLAARISAAEKLLDR